MYNFKLKETDLKRLSDFTRSALYSTEKENSKSSYWQDQAALLNSKTNEDQVSVSGESGFYIPPERGFFGNLIRRILMVIESPSILVNKITHVLFGLPKMFSYKNAFDLVLNHSPLSDPDLSPFRINHLNWKNKSGLFLNSKSVKADFEKWSGRNIFDHIYLHYYYLNIIKSSLMGKKINRVLEIGAGNGNFPSILFQHFQDASIILIDLPEMIPVSFSYLSSIYPKANILLPNDVEKEIPLNFDFLLLTTSQLNLIKSESIDLAINCHSFQEMPKTQIEEYFGLIERVLKKGSFFFTANRLEKLPVGNDSYTEEQADQPNRFFLYPWRKNAIVLVDEISRFTRLVQLDGIGIRMEITKPNTSHVK